MRAGDRDHRCDRVRVGCRPLQGLHAPHRAAGDAQELANPQRVGQLLLQPHHVRNGHVVLDFDDTANESADFPGSVSSAYSNSGNQTVRIVWSATTAVSGTVRWSAQLERQQTGVGFDLDSDDLSTSVSVDASAATNTGSLVHTDIDLDSLPAADVPIAGETFRLRITRDATHANDSLVGDAELLSVELKEL